MSYLVTFLEGVITFISPCLLPMLPIYLSYFAAGTQGPGSKRATAKKCAGVYSGVHRHLSFCWARWQAA